MSSKPFDLIIACFFLLLQPDCEFILCFYSDDMLKIQVAFAGLEDTPFQGGTFEVELRIPSNFPFKSPEVRDSFLKIMCK